jgi:hypothetical protein
MGHDTVVTMSGLHSPSQLVGLRLIQADPALLSPSVSNAEWSPFTSILLVSLNRG